jgi:hypothetical protein
LGDLPGPARGEPGFALERDAHVLGCSNPARVAIRSIDWSVSASSRFTWSDAHEDLVRFRIDRSPRA